MIIKLTNSKQMKSFSKLLIAAFLFLTFACNDNKTSVSVTKGNDALNNKPYVVLVSFDGFRWDYPTKANMTVLDSMAKYGIHAESLQPCFPTKTFPNHYSIATGLYPDNHGIVNNSFYSPEMKDIYKIGKAEAVENGKYYAGTPIWNLAEKQGVKAASFYWVGSEADIQNSRPSYWKKYDHGFPFEQRVDTVISWLKLPPEERPHFVSLYFHEPDSKGHKYGPDSEEVKSKLEEMNTIMKRLFDGLNSLPIKDKINVIITSDHGMENISNDSVVNLFPYIKQKYVERVVGSNPVYNIWAKKEYIDSINSALKGVKHVTCWKNKDIPERLHYGKNIRTGTHTLLADLGWTIQYSATNKPVYGGTHGYDNANKSMHAIFYGIGPAFKSGFKSETIRNIDIYPLIAHILNLKVGKIDGNYDNVKMFLKKP